MLKRFVDTVVFRFFIICCLSTLVGSCQPTLKIIHITGSTMGTGYMVKVVGEDTGWDEDSLKQMCTQELEKINDLMSTYRSHSELSRFNQAPLHEWFEISEHLLKVIKLAHEISEQTEGAFDITIGSIVNLWGFNSQTGRNFKTDKRLTKAAIDAAWKNTGYKHLEWRDNPPALRKSVNVYVDLSAIAKGYAVDLLAETLLHMGVQNFLVEIGGEIRVGGHNAKSQPWEIAIELPAKDLYGVFAQTLSLNAAAVATSGNYRNYIESDGGYYSHTINPITGEPVFSGLFSVTVVGISATRTDALATALAVMQADAGLKFADRHNIAALFIVESDKGFSQRASAAMKLQLALGAN